LAVKTWIDILYEVLHFLLDLVFQVWVLGIDWKNIVVIRISLELQFYLLFILIIFDIIIFSKLGWAYLFFNNSFFSVHILINFFWRLILRYILNLKIWLSRDLCFHNSWILEALVWVERQDFQVFIRSHFFEFLFLLCIFHKQFKIKIALETIFFCFDFRYH
jgi:hypothetical protein